VLGHGLGDGALERLGERRGAPLHQGAFAARLLTLERGAGGGGDRRGEADEEDRGPPGGRE